MLLSRVGDRRAGSSIQEGDLVIVYENHERMKAVQVSAGDTLQNRFGSFKHSDWVGKPFGSKVHSCTQGGFVHLLAPTPELWTLVLQHRTQILYAPDISLVTSFLELKPGSIVLESGTGSGSLTTCLARAVAPTGHVHTFEFHQPRATAARAEFDRNGLSSLVTVRVRDVEAQGLPAELAGQADAVFLDLPGPWNAVASAACVLRPDAPFCSFSPCMEQVQRTCEELTTHGFTDIRTFEILLRSYDVRSEPSITNLFDTGGATRSQGQEPAQKRQRREEQRQEARAGLSSTAETVNGIEERSCEGQGHSNGPCGQEGAAQGTGNGRGSDADAPQEEKRVRDGPPKSTTSLQDKPVKVVLARPTAETRGHTGYLTFARRAC